MRSFWNRWHHWIIAAAVVELCSVILYFVHFVEPWWVPWLSAVVLLIVLSFDYAEWKRTRKRRENK